MEQSNQKRLFGKIFAFDVPNSEFELLETEKGEPAFFGNEQQSVQHGADAPNRGNNKNAEISPSVKVNKARLFEELNGDINTDLILRPFLMGGKVPALAAFFDGMADSDQINDFILKPALQSGCMDHAGTERAQYALHSVFTMQEAALTRTWQRMKEAVEEGQTAVFLDGDSTAVLMDTRGYACRSVSEPKNETVILGPHEAFTENIRTNVTLLRRIIKTDDFVVEHRCSGGQNKNRIAIMYRAGVANPALVNEVKRRFAGVNTLMVLTIGTLEQLTERHSFSPLPQSLTTERPDRVAGLLMQGHVAVLCEGSPQSAVMPATLFTLMSSGQDAYLRQPIGTIIRIVRYIGALLSLLMPAYFLALAMHHQGMLSTEILATTIASRNMVFLPLPIEMIFLLLVFQLVREAGISAPGAMGQSVGIIGGLVMGQAAVSANIISKVVLVIVALTGLGNFAIPDFSTQIAAAYFRIFLVLLAWCGGLLGLVMGILLTVCYLSGLKSYGVPFLTPVAPKVNANGPVLMRHRVTMHQRPEDDMNTVGERP